MVMDQTQGAMRGPLNKHNIHQMLKVISKDVIRTTLMVVTVQTRKECEVIIMTTLIILRIILHLIMLTQISSTGMLIFNIQLLLKTSRIITRIMSCVHLIK